MQSYFGPPCFGACLDELSKEATQRSLFVLLKNKINRQNVFKDRLTIRANYYRYIRMYMALANNDSSVLCELWETNSAVMDVKRPVGNLKAVHLHKRHEFSLTCVLLVISSRLNYSRRLG